MKRLFLILALVALSLQSQAVTKFCNYFYSLGSIDDYCRTLHMEFILENYDPSDIIVISVFHGKDDTAILKERFHKFNLETNLEGKPHNGFKNKFTIRNMEPGAYYTLVCTINGKMENYHSLKMLGPIPVPDFNVYPNPSKGEFVIETPFNQSTIIIYDTEGRVVYSNDQISYEEKINDFLPNGIYFVTLKREKDILEVKKLFINR